MTRIAVLFLWILTGTGALFAQHYTLTGKVLDSRTKAPVDYAALLISASNLWAVTDEKGTFTVERVPAGQVTVSVTRLGYAKQTFNVAVAGDRTDIELLLPEDNLTLNEVTVTATRKAEALTSTYVIDRQTLDHQQLINVGDIAALLPGGQTGRYNNLTQSSPRFTLRSENGENGLPSFGTALEVDGVRLSNNASGSETAGTDTRNISTSNIQSVEVITGIPSVAYGDINNGIVRINTRRGKSPYLIETAIRPHTQLYAIHKGFDLHRNRGVLNAGFERARSVSDVASPYTAYDRNTLMLQYANNFRLPGGRSLALSAGVTGNIGGMNTKADPDAFRDTYDKSRDNALRAQLSLDWLLHKPWLTSLQFTASAGYADKSRETKTNKSSSSSLAAIHATEEGYFVATDYDRDPQAPVILLPAGYWYEVKHVDDKPVQYAARLKAVWAEKFGRVNSHLMLGTELNGSGNKGRGEYYEEMRYAPTWREYRYDEQPFVNNIAVYAEEKLSVPLGKTNLQLVAGLRSDITSISKSEYGRVSSLSPRANVKYTFFKHSGHFIRTLSIRTGWGKAVKLPSFGILYPTPSYGDKLSFAPGTLADGTTYYAYYTIPAKAIYNPDLQWQTNLLSEVGVEARLKGMRVSLSLFRNRTKHPYITSTVYTPYAYKMADQTALESCLIPSADRLYHIDPTSGIVTVSDKLGIYPDQQLAYKEKKTFKANTMYTNGSPIVRQGIEWMIDFDRIRVLRTSFTLDGKYYYYKGVEETVTAHMPASAQFMADGNPYKYIGFYAGGANVSNGYKTRKLNANFTAITHIPDIRLIVSLRFEGSFYNYRQNLSEYQGRQQSFALDNKADYFPSQDASSLTKGENYAALYPLYYVSYEDMQTKIPFAEKFAWARENDPALYNELAKLVEKSNTAHYFKPNRTSVYYSANINVTKEIGRFASISFNAVNFFNNMKKVKSRQTNTETSLYHSQYIPEFYYGISLKIKI